jgi:hypothetical protein
MIQVYLSERNLLTLLNKLKARKAGEVTACTIIKNDDRHPTHPQSHKDIHITAVADEDYYTDRLPGAMHPRDDPNPEGLSTFPIFGKH